MRLRNSIDGAYAGASEISSRARAAGSWKAHCISPHKQVLRLRSLVARGRVKLPLSHATPAGRHVRGRALEFVVRQGDNGIVAEHPLLLARDGVRHNRGEDSPPSRGAPLGATALSTICDTKSFDSPDSIVMSSRASRISLSLFRWDDGSTPSSSKWEGSSRGVLRMQFHNLAGCSPPFPHPVREVSAFFDFAPSVASVEITVQGRGHRVRTEELQ